MPGFPLCAVHVPLPVADIVAVPPGNMAHTTVLSIPASGLDVTTTLAVSVQPLAFVQIKLYDPAALYVVIVVVGDDVFVIVAVPGFPLCAVHVPLPVADIVAVPPGNMAHTTVLSIPASGFDVTTTLAVSEHPLIFVQMKL